MDDKVCDDSASGVVSRLRGGGGGGLLLEDCPHLQLASSTRRLARVVPVGRALKVVTLAAAVLLFLSVVPDQALAFQVMPVMDRGTATMMTDTTSMLLKVKGLSSLLTNTRSVPQLGPPDHHQPQTSEQEHPDGRRARGVLGFRVDPSEGASSSAFQKEEQSSSSALHATRPGRPTKVDSSAWNVPNQWTVGGEAANGVAAATALWPSSSSSILRKNALVGGETTTAATSYDIPWIPSREQIESLKVVELKQVCAARGLKVSGRKAELQQRILEWAETEGRLALQRSRTSSFPSLNLFQAYGTPSSSSASAVVEDTKSSNLQDPETTTRRHNNNNNKRVYKSRGYNNKDLSDNNSIDSDSNSPNSLAEWARTVDLEPLLHRRQAIHEEKLHGKKVVKKQPKDNHRNDSSKGHPSYRRSSAAAAEDKDDYRSIVTKIFGQPSSPYSNREVKQMYAAAKHSDQMGDRALSKRILLELQQCTPHDARIVKRLARMEQEDGNLDRARAILQDAVRPGAVHADNAYLWHGLGQLAETSKQAAACYEKAIQVDPSLPHPHHALGTMQHTAGRIAAAMKTFKRGISYCPTNHRLHHALGDLYRDAKMLPMAERSYRKALKHGPAVSHGFAYTALAYTAYEQGQVEDCRSWLRRAISLNQGRQVNAWVALAQLEESLGNMDAARAVCCTGLAQYERRLLERYRRQPTQRQRGGKRRYDSSGKPIHGDNDKVNNNNIMDRVDERALLEDPVAAKRAFLQSVPSYRSGDRFFNLYRNWARLEERYGSVESVDEVYERARIAFPAEYKIPIDWAEYYVTLNMQDRARSLYHDSCCGKQAGAGARRHYAAAASAEPYRLYAEFEMNHGNYTGARQILYAGAMSLTSSPAPTASSSASNSGGGGGGGGSRGAHRKNNNSNPNEKDGLAKLFYTWAVCEWHLGELSRAENLFDRALRLTDPEQDAKLRSYILYSIAVLEHFRGEHVLAQHCIALCLKENAMPGGNSRVWDLWTIVAERLGNDDLADECREQATKCYEDAKDEFGLQQLLGRKRGTATSATAVGGSGIGPMMRRDPWHSVIFGSGERPDKFYHAIRFPFRVERQTTVHHEEEETSHYR